jgi:DNA-binding CsgD family transcriptional regulator
MPFTLPDPVSLPRVLDEIGRQTLAPTLLNYLTAAVGAEHCVLYRFDEDDLEVLGVASASGGNMAANNSARYRREFWRRDATFLGLKRDLRGYQSEVSCLAAEQIIDPQFRHEMILTQQLAGRAMLLGERNSQLFGVSLFRGQQTGFFSTSERQAIESLADMLISCVAKHNDVLARADSLQSVFSSIEELEANFKALPLGLSQRECEVCARIAYGLSMKEIARDLDISANSGVTYRRRAYQRLGATNRSELVRQLLQYAGGQATSGPVLAAGPARV